MVEEGNLQHRCSCLGAAYRSAWRFRATSRVAESTPRHNNTTTAVVQCQNNSTTVVEVSVRSRRSHPCSGQAALDVPKATPSVPSYPQVIKKWACCRKYLKNRVYLSSLRDLSRSYPHAHALDPYDFRIDHLLRIGACLGRRWNVGKRHTVDRGQHGPLGMTTASPLLSSD
jgi:hypothetical protein